MPILTSSGLAYDNAATYVQNTAGTLTSALNVINGNGANTYSATNIPSNYNKIYINLYSTGYSSGPQTPQIIVKDASATFGTWNYHNILTGTTTQNGYYGSSTNGPWVATPYYTMTDFTMEISRAGSYYHTYKMFGQGGSTGTTNLLQSFGYITTINNISTVTLGASSTYTFVNMILDISWD